MRRAFMIVLAVVTALGLAAPVMAATAADQIVTQLRDQGFTQIEVEKTWLGRTRIVAERKDASREIILNPGTGEILRDLWLPKGGKGSPKVKIGRDDDNDGSGSGESGGDSGEDDDDDDEDEDDDSDNSGSGSGDNSGSGSGHD